MKTTTKISPPVSPNIAGEGSAFERQLDAVVGLGANLGDRRTTLRRAVAELFAERGIRGLAVSALYETDPVGPPQPDYLNAAVRLELHGTPEALLDVLLAIEHRSGRTRTERWGPRPLDLDLLWLEGVEVSTARLVVPHPRLHERRFALAPLLDVAPDAVDPRTGLLIARALDELAEGGIRRLAGPEWFESETFR